MDLSSQDEQFVQQLLAMRVILYPKLFIKDHNKINNKGEFTTILLIPETNLTAELYKIGYLEIKGIMEKAKLNYKCVTIVQASDLKESLEKFEIRIDVVTKS